MKLPFALAVMLSLHLAMPFAESGAIVAQELEPIDEVGCMFFRHDRYYGAMSGQCVNPREGSRPALLAKIGALLIAYVKAEPGAEKEIADQLGERMDMMDSQIDALE